MRPDFAQLLHGYTKSWESCREPLRCVFLDSGQPTIKGCSFLEKTQSLLHPPRPKGAQREMGGVFPVSQFVGQSVQGRLEREICRDREDKQCLNGRVWKTISQGQDVRHDRACNGWAVIKFLVIFSSVFQYACDWFLQTLAKTPETNLLADLPLTSTILCVCVSLHRIQPNSYVKIPWENPGMTA